MLFKGKKTEEQYNDLKRRKKEIRQKKIRARLTEKPLVKKILNTRLGKFVASSLSSSIDTLKNCNKGILLLIVLLTGFGILMVFSASYYQTIYMVKPDPLFYMKRQMFNAATGFVLLVFFAGYDYHKYEKWGNFVIIASIISLVLVLFFGVDINGARRWFDLGFMSITPSEFSKVFVIIFTATYLNRHPRRIKDVKYQLFLLGIAGVHFILIFQQPNLSTAVVVALIMGAVLLVGGLPLGYILGALGVAGGGAALILTVPGLRSMHWYSRLTSFADPFADAQGSGYQVSQGLIALGNGGLKGLGLGNSVAKNLYLPEPQNDFILAIIGEELGFISLVILISVYALLFYLCIMTAVKSKDRLGFYLATGVGVMLALQVIINVAVVTSSMPPTGITLPFISYGGTSIWTFMIAMGIVLNVSKNQIRIRSQKGSQNANTERRN